MPEILRAHYMGTSILQEPCHNKIEEGMCNSIFKLNGTPILKKWLSRFTTVLLFFLSAS
jgi:hypothetical protein